VGGQRPGEKSSSKYLEDWLSVSEDTQVEAAKGAVVYVQSFDGGSACESEAEAVQSLTHSPSQQELTAAVATDLFDGGSEGEAEAENPTDKSTDKSADEEDRAGGVGGGLNTRRSKVTFWCCPQLLRGGSEQELINSQAQVKIDELTHAVTRPIAHSLTRLSTHASTQLEIMEVLEPETCVYEVRVCMRMLCAASIFDAYPRLYSLQYQQQQQQQRLQQQQQQQAQQQQQEQLQQEQEQEQEQQQQMTELQRISHEQQTSARNSGHCVWVASFVLREEVQPQPAWGGTWGTPSSAQQALPSVETPGTICLCQKGHCSAAF
jgi:hypothetical protein